MISILLTRLAPSVLSSTFGNNLNASLKVSHFDDRTLSHNTNIGVSFRESVLKIDLFQMFQLFLKIDGLKPTLPHIEKRLFINY